MVATLAERDEFDFLLQLQTDPFRMPIENNGVLWPTSLSPRVPVAVLRIPRQHFDSPEQLSLRRSCRSTRGTAYPSTGPSTIKIGPGSACTPSSLAYGNR
jgi:hypothetical protein